MDPNSVTVENVKDAYNAKKLNNADYYKFLQDAVDYQQNPDKQRQLSLDSKQLDSILELNQLGNLAHPKSNNDFYQRDQLETAIRGEIDVQQQKGNRKLSWQEKGQIARDMTIDKVYTSTPTMWMGGKLKPAAILTQDEIDKATVFVGGQKVKLTDIPAQYQSQAMQDLQANKLPTTQANIAAWWVKKGKPTQ